MRRFRKHQWFKQYFTPTRQKHEVRCIIDRTHLNYPYYPHNPSGADLILTNNEDHYCRMTSWHDNDFRITVFCEEKPPVTSGCTSQKSCDTERCYFYLSIWKTFRLKPSGCWWFETSYRLRDVTLIWRINVWYGIDLHSGKPTQRLVATTSGRYWQC